MTFLFNSLVKKGFDVKLHDVLFEEDSVQCVIEQFSPDYIGLSLRNIDDVKVDSTRYFIPEVVKLIEAIRSVSTAPIILGGSGFSLFPMELMNLTGADFGLCGEAEVSLPMLLDILNISDRSLIEKEFTTTPGLVYKGKQGPVQNEYEREIYAQNDKIEYPRELVTRYLDASSMVNIQTQRGCPFSCCYCSYPVIEGKTVRFRPAEAVVDEIESLSRAGARYFYIVDSVFNINRNHVVSFCEEIIRRKITVSWSCFLRPAGMTFDLMELMARAGLKHIEFGSDSLCDEILHNYTKGFTFDDILQSSELARKANIHYAHFLIPGGPGEREDTLQTTFRNSLFLKKTVLFPFIGMRILPSTKLHTISIEQNVILNDSSLLEPAFYISPYISKDIIDKMLVEFHKQSPRWIISEPDTAQLAVMNGLRKKGVCGPLWEFLAS
ncbi:MAG: radical SAM protein [Fibrobacter sp.]|nr:radical SAM protein [Fibrobacter sp.]